MNRGSCFSAVFVWFFLVRAGLLGQRVDGPLSIGGAQSRIGWLGCKGEDLGGVALDRVGVEIPQLVESLGPPGPTDGSATLDRLTLGFLPSSSAGGQWPARADLEVQ